MASESKLSRGIDTLNSIDPRGYANLSGLDAVAPGLADSVVEFAFGDIANRGELDLKTRELVTVASLAGMGGAQPQLTAHLVYALRLGWRPEELREALIQVVPVLGLPRVLNALSALGDARAAIAEGVTSS